MSDYKNRYDPPNILEQAMTLNKEISDFVAGLIVMGCVALGLALWLVDKDSVCNDKDSNFARTKRKNAKSQFQHKAKSNRNDAARGQRISREEWEQRDIRKNMWRELHRAQISPPYPTTNPIIHVNRSFFHEESEIECLTWRASEGAPKWMVSDDVYDSDTTITPALLALRRTLEVDDWIIIGESEAEFREEIDTDRFVDEN